jgi:cysteine sulfinate desulfinase/cysteine desulfurase-like protein
MPHYLDHNAISPMHAPIIDAMPPYLQSPLRRPRVVSIGGGTENLAAPGWAARLARLEIEHRRLHIEQSKDLFESRLRQLPESVVFGRQAMVVRQYGG